MSQEYMKFGLFAYELVKSVAKSSSKHKWNTKILSYYKSVTNDSGFNIRIADAIFWIIDHNNDLICDCFDELDQSGRIPEVHLAYHALNAVPAYFPEGYTPGHFLSFCSMLLGVALFYLEAYNYENILVSAAEIIQTVLTYFTLISDFDKAEDLPELIRVSEHCCRKLRAVKKR